MKDIFEYADGRRSVHEVDADGAITLTATQLPPDQIRTEGADLAPLPAPDEVIDSNG